LDKEDNMTNVSVTKKIPCNKKGLKIYNVTFLVSDLGNAYIETKLIMADEDLAKAKEQIEERFNPRGYHIRKIRETVDVVDITF
jgi:hypothetical protein